MEPGLFIQRIPSASSAWKPRKKNINRHSANSQPSAQQKLPIVVFFRIRLRLITTTIFPLLKARTKLKRADGPPARPHSAELLIRADSFRSGKSLYYRRSSNVVSGNVVINVAI